MSLDPDWRERALGIITNPNVAYLLLLVGIYGIIFEFAHPGMVLSGVIGAICLVLGLFALNLLPIDYAGVALIVLGIALMIGEGLAPGFGALGLGGAGAFALGSLILFDTAPGFALSPVIVVVATLLTAGLFSGILAFALRAQRRRQVTGDAVILGELATVLSWRGGDGQVHVHGERWQARAAEPLEAGQRVRVLGREGLVLRVAPASPSDTR